MIEPNPRNGQAIFPSGIGAQPIVVAAVALVLILFGIGSIAAWRIYTGQSPEQDRIAAARQMQARTAQTSEQLVEKTKGLEATQQESIDQLQVLQDQLQATRRALAVQQGETKKLSEQVTALTEAMEGLRQSFAQGNEPAAEPVSPGRSGKTRYRKRVQSKN